ncbi:MAG: PepSY domain-containing protein [Rhodoferax sp.]|nr:PepSY domain-containing protein [Rhodoferax sp.]
MKFLLTFFTVALMALASPAWAEISRDDATSLARQATGGRVLAVEKIEREGRPVWRVKVLTPQGEVRLVLIDVASGRTL